MTGKVLLFLLSASMLVSCTTGRSLSKNGGRFLTGSQVEKLCHIVDDVAQSPESLSAIANDTATCKRWTAFRRDLMKEESVLYARERDALFDVGRMEEEVRASKVIFVLMQTPVGPTIFVVVPKTGGKVAVVQDFEKETPARDIQDVMRDLRRLPELDWGTDKAEVQLLEDRLWGRDGSVRRNTVRGSARFEAIISAKLGSSDADFKRRLSGMKRAIEHWLSTQMKSTAKTEGIGLVFGAGGALVQENSDDFALIGIFMSHLLEVWDVDEWKNDGVVWDEERGGSCQWEGSESAGRSSHRERRKLGHKCAGILRTERQFSSHVGREICCGAGRSLGQKDPS